MESSMFVVYLIIFLILNVVIIRSGHKSAVEKSEARLRAYFDQGHGSSEARQLMRQAGYNV